VPTAAHPHVSRYVVGFDAAQKQQLKQQLQEHGYRILTEGSGFFTVTHPTAPEAHASFDESGSSSSSHRRRLIEAAHQQHTERLNQLAGVHSSEQDVRRYLHIRPSAPLDGSNSRTLQAADSSSSTGGLSKLLGPWHTGQVPHGRTAYMQWGAEVVDATCAAKDEQLQPQVPNSEVLPWGIKEVGAWNPDLQKLTPKGRTIVCVIDSGLWGGHPEYSGAAAADGSPQNTFSGCQGSGSCPYEWKSDVVGHGTHVTGTIGAPHNGVGVVGVMSQGAEVHVVRVWNNSGDVSQGQGPYATDLVLAYSHCLSRLKAEQAAEKSGNKVNMVINMSFGSAGPLTVERMWIERAAKRGDVLFVGSAGNNGSFLDVGKRAAGPASLSGQSGKEPVGQYLSYPASYSLNEVSPFRAYCEVAYPTVHTNPARACGCKWAVAKAVGAYAAETFNSMHLW
jgi:subtilisin family serine protease